jgi:hypothetical protein
MISSIEAIVADMEEACGACEEQLPKDIPEVRQLLNNTKAMSVEERNQWLHYLRQPIIPPNTPILVETMSKRLDALKRTPYYPYDSPQVAKFARLVVC